jgi:hypothetical protein
MYFFDFLNTTISSGNSEKMIVTHITLSNQKSSFKTSGNHVRRGDTFRFRQCPKEIDNKTSSAGCETESTFLSEQRQLYGLQDRIWTDLPTTSRDDFPANSIVFGLTFSLQYFKFWRRNTNNPIRSFFFSGFRASARRAV